jgi:hypothetical protein
MRSGFSLGLLETDGAKSSADRSNEIVGVSVRSALRRTYGVIRINNSSSSSCLVRSEVRTPTAGVVENNGRPLRLL